MRRHPSLHPLSDDHHRALVLARRLRRASTRMDAAAVAALAVEVRRVFDTDLEPHFRVEERWLLPPLEGRGAGDLVEQTAGDHARLRALARGLWSGDTAQEFGTLLEKHVRFEERVLFPKAEELLLGAELASVHDAVQAGMHRSDAGQRPANGDREPDPTYQRSARLPRGRNPNSGERRKP